MKSNQIGMTFCNISDIKSFLKLLTTAKSLFILSPMTVQNTTSETTESSEL